MNGSADVLKSAISSDCTGVGIAKGNMGFNVLLRIFGLHAGRVLVVCRLWRQPRAKIERNDVTASPCETGERNDA